MVGHRWTTRTAPPPSYVGGMPIVVVSTDTSTNASSLGRRGTRDPQLPSCSLYCKMPHWTSLQLPW